MRYIMSKDSWSQTAWPWAGFAFGRRQRFFESGEVRLALLSLLQEGPKHGYQLMKELEERSGGMYKASAGSVYPTLQQLEDEGLVEAATIGGRRTYNLTAAGRQELDKHPETVRRIWERAEEFQGWRGCWAPEAIPVYGPMAELMKTCLQAAARLRDKREGADRIRAILDRARKELDAL
jgi:DNA-binding PadR family transcriptional regulator